MFQLKVIAVVFLSSTLITSSPIFAAPPATKTPESIVQEAEKIRAIDQVTSKVEVITINGKEKTEYKLDVLQGSQRRSYIEFTYPDEELNRRMLAIKTQYWTKFAGVKNRVVPISRREAIGNSAFAMADVFQMDTKEDYSVKLLGEEVIDKEPSLKLQLDAKGESAPYFRIIYFVRKSDSYPKRAEFFGNSGNKLKVMTVEKSEVRAGRMRPTLLRMEDLVIKNRYSTWRNLGMSATKIPDEVFTQAYLLGR